MKPVKGVIKNGVKTAKKNLAAAKSTVAKVKAVTTKKSSAKLTTIEARIDVGFGNNLFLRGEGNGLSWNSGVPLQCVDGKTWRWSTQATDNLKFKLLLNDAVWSQGEDLVAKPGAKVEIQPQF